VEYLEEANQPTNLWRQLRNTLRSPFPIPPLSFLDRASHLLGLFQNRPREATQQALGEASAMHPTLWRVLCLGLQSYDVSADRFFLATAAARVAVAYWETPPAVGKLREALTQQQGGTVDTLCGQTVLELARELRPHPALHQLLPSLKKLQRNPSLQPLCQELQARIQAIPKKHLPIPTETQQIPPDFTDCNSPKRDIP
jgi:hypothetical protein